MVKPQLGNSFVLIYLSAEGIPSNEEGVAFMVSKGPTVVRLLGEKQTVIQ